MTQKFRIAHLSGPNATITNTPPLVTSNKARVRAGLEPLKDVDGNPSRFDPLRSQRLAAPVTVYVEQFSAHPLESDAAALYGPPDGYVNADGAFSESQGDGFETPVYKVELSPADGLIPLPYMALQADGRPWEYDGAELFAGQEQSRQPFFPDGRRLFEEVDRLGVSTEGHGNGVSDRAEVSFYRVVPSGGYTNGGPDGVNEEAGKDFFAYRPVHLNASPPRMSLARITNDASDILAQDDIDGAIWTQGSPRIEETTYWLSLLIDTTKPIIGNASQRYNGAISNDGPKNIVDSVDWLTSKVWADEAGRNRCGVVMVQDQRAYAAREIAKVDARPGGYEATGGHGGVIGSADHGRAVLRFVPAVKHTWQSDVRLSQLPDSTMGLLNGAKVDVQIKDEAGKLLDSAIGKVSIVKDSSYAEDDWGGDPDQEVDVIALMERMSATAPLSGFVLEGLNPYGKAAAASKTRIMTRAAFSGFPVVNVGRGNTQGFAIAGGPFIAGSNLTSVKARMLLLACLMKFGMLPVAKDPDAPTPEERAAVMAALKPYQAVFDTH